MVPQCCSTGNLPALWMWLARRLRISTSDPGDAASESTSGEGA